MEKLFVNFKNAKGLKEIDFDEPCIARFRKGSLQLYSVIKEHKYNSEPISKTDISAPTFEQAFSFIREKYNLHAYIEPILVEQAKSPIKFDFVILELDGNDENYEELLPFHTYEQAREACLEKLIELCKKSG